MAIETIQVASEAEFQSAIGAIGDGGVIEMLSGTYVAPPSGFVISNAGKSFSVQEASGATVVLTGIGSRPVLLLTNSSPGTGHSVVFVDLTFANGYSNQNGTGAGVTVSAANATFINCTFQNNVAAASTTGGGGVFAWGGSEIHFSDCIWIANTSTNEGGGLRVSDSKAFVHNSTFTDNRTNVQQHRNSAAGGGIHVTNGTLHVSNTRFSGNRAGCVGGAIFGLGNWREPAESPSSDILISNSTFVDNAVIPYSGITCAFTPVGGAIHTEDQTTLEVFSSRFESNAAAIGGAISQYRSITNIFDSQFFENDATGSTTKGFGGAIMSNSNDANDSSTGYGTVNRRSASLTIEDTLFVGKRDGTGSNSLKGGCIFVEGDMARSYGSPVVPNMDDAITNRATVRIRRCVFSQCRVAEDGVTVGTGAGGALEIGHADLEIADSILSANAATGSSQSSGGGIRILYESTALLQDTTFAHNIAGTRSGAVHIFGSSVDINRCEFYGNQVFDGGAGSVVWARPAPQGWYWSLGGGSFENPDVNVSGSILGSTFVDNSAIDIEERDFDLGPINDLTYFDNRFFDSTSDTIVFRNELEGTATAASLNSMTVGRSGAANTIKSPDSDNDVLSSQPKLGSLRAAPRSIFGTNAAGDPPPPTDAFLASVWSGGSATIDGTPLAGTSGTDLRSASSGGHTLLVSGASFTDSVNAAAVPSISLSANPDVITRGSTADLEWVTWSGTHLATNIDRGIQLGSSAASGEVAVTPSETTTYHVHILAEEGGAWETATVWVNDPLLTIFSDGFESSSASEWSSQQP